MSPRLLIVLLLLACVVGWWRSPFSPRVPDAPAVAAGQGACPMPPWRDARAWPVQLDVPDGIGPVRLEAGTLTPLAAFRVDARVLSREDYSMGREADFSPTDLALGWGRMREDAVLDRLDIEQGGRWFRYRWQGEPPIPVEEIVRSAANMHLIPADATAARALARVRAGDRVEVAGWLVRAEGPDGWRWQSSLTREDSGDGACELIYACSIRTL